MVEQVCRAPQELDAVFLHLLLDERHDGIQVGLEFAQACTLGRNVLVVEAEVFDAQLVHELKACQNAVARDLHGITAAEGLVLGARAEHVGTLGAQCVPVGHGKFQVILHGASCDDLIGIVVAERQIVGSVRTFIFDFLNFGKEFHGSFSFYFYMFLSV